MLGIILLIKRAKQYKCLNTHIHNNSNAYKPIHMYSYVRLNRIYCIRAFFLLFVNILYNKYMYVRTL